MARQLLQSIGVMSSQSDQLKQRTLTFGVDVLRLVDDLPRTLAGQTIGRQLARSGPAIGSNYRATCSARSRMEFIARLGIVVEEAEESVYWLDLILNAQMMDERRVQPLRQEAAELLDIFARSIGTARLNARATKNARSVASTRIRRV